MATKALHWRISSHYGRLSDFFVDFDGASYRQMARWFEGRCERLAESLKDPEARLFQDRPQDLSQAMAHLQPEDASCFQWSDVRAGVDRDLNARFERLWTEFIARYEKHTGRDRIDESRICEKVTAALGEHGLQDRVEHGFEIKGGNLSHVFPHKWMNGGVEVLDAISLDIADSTRLLNKAATWAGRLLCLSTGPDFKMTGVVAPPADPKLAPAYRDALAILRDAPKMRAVHSVDEMQTVLAQIERDLAQHPAD